MLAVKNKAIKAFAELLIAKPEQEKNLLGMLVNKMVCAENSLPLALPRMCRWAPTW